MLDSGVRVLFPLCSLHVSIHPPLPPGEGKAVVRNQLLPISENLDSKKSTLAD